MFPFTYQSYGDVSMVMVIAKEQVSIKVTGNELANSESG